MAGYDWASLIGAILVIMVSVAINLLAGGSLTLEFLVLLSVLRFVTWALYGFMALIIIEAVFSWVNPHAPLAPFVRALNDPLMRPLRRFVPPIGGIDLTPLVALLLLQIALRVFTYALSSLA